MSDTMEVRDHSQSCEHDEAWQESPDYPWVCRLGSSKYPECPGGKRIVLRQIWDEFRGEDTWQVVEGSDDE